MLRPKFRALLSEAIDAAANYAAMRSLKHTDTPDEDTIAAAIVNAVWVELDERFHIEDDDMTPREPKTTLLEIAATALLVVAVMAAVIGIVYGATGCDRVRQMQPPADPWASVVAAAEAQRTCEEAARICDTCEDPSALIDGGVAPCTLVCLDAVQECIEASEALARKLEPAEGDAGAGGA